MESLEESRIQLGNNEEDKVTPEVVYYSKSSGDGDKEKDALAILPVEIWTKILSKVVNAEEGFDESCFLTCKLFSAILEQMKTQWLFGKIFPFIYRRLQQADVLSCRITCKYWMTAVDRRIDNLLESGSAIADRSSYITLQEFTQYYYPIYGCQAPITMYDFRSAEANRVANHSFYDSYIIIRSLRNVIPEMRLHPRNPFLGRSVSFMDFLSSAVFVQEAQDFLEDCGQHIWHLLIRVRKPNMHAPLDDDGLKTLACFLQCLNLYLVKTPNLKTLHLDLVGLWGKPTISADLKLLCPSLEALIIRLPNYSQKDKKVMKMYVDALVSPLSTQLIRFDVCFWTKRFIKYQWPHLTELKLRKVKSEKTLTGLLQVTLPALITLRIEFDHKHLIKMPMVFVYLLRITNHFPKLSTLELGKLTSQFSKVDDPASMAFPPNFYAPSRLSTLKILSPIWLAPAWNSFFLQFPSLKNLYICVADFDTGHRNWLWYSSSGCPTRSDYTKEMFPEPIQQMFPLLQVLAFKYRAGSLGHRYYTIPTSCLKFFPCIFNALVESDDDE